ncbi:carbohydrate ABC transporter permease [Rhizomicrobium electricum]|uniref:Sugar ABC transporter permease n=1 Tax=Rhizomicrobium electricum TaxID=480070 RepID=A0ABN1F6X1_9PROT|nr:sugar ABC transporter permease [Rhizomicrobium electricum]NIJ50392.1 multiple sugar transport system permease protein [Rhizomicrobium electricum]
MRTRRLSPGFLFAAPALFVLTVFFFGPVCAAFVMSLTDFDIYALASLHNLRFVGFANYLDLLQTPLFWRAFANTCYFAFVGAPLSIAVSLIAAMALNVPAVRLKSLHRTALFAPYVASLVAAAVVWRYLLGSGGAFDEILHAIGLPAVDWLGDPRWSMPAIILFAVWKNFGYNMLILLAALQNVPQDLYDAARVDGAGPWMRFHHVTVPGIAPSLWLVALLTTAGYFQIFAEPYVMTQGGPAQSTVTLLYFMYQDGFKWWNLGHASATAFILFAVLVGLSLLRPRTREGVA